MLKALMRGWIVLFLGFAGMAQGSTLSDLAASMQPGAWAELQTIGLNQNLLVAPNSHHILQFSDDMVWDPNGKQLIFVGGGHGSGAGHIVYNELTNTWLRIPLSWGGGFSHAYDHNAIVPSRNRLYHRRPEDSRVWILNLATGAWSTTASITDNVQCCGALEYFPELGTLIFVDGDWGVFSYDIDANRWTQVSPALAMGDYHNFAEYSSVHRVLTFGGGGGNAEGAASNRAIFRMNASGNISQATSSPINLGIYDTVTTTDPISGNMLVFGNNDSYEYNPGTDSWRRFAGRAPFVTAGEMTTVFGSVATPIPEYGVVAVATYNGNSSKMFLYKHSPGSPQPTPTVTLNANPTSVAPQGSSTLTWSTTNATGCTASGGWSGTKAVNGSESVGPLTAITTYTLTCTATGGGSTSRSATVTVSNPTPAPTVTLSANPTSVPAQGNSTLTWSSTNATGCTASGGWSGARATSGSATVGPLAASTTYNLSCTGAGGTTQRSVTVNLLPAPGVTFSANPTTVTAGARSTLTWSSTNATGCAASGAWAGNKATSGSEQTPVLNSTSTFTLGCNGAGGTTSRSTTVTVNGAPPPPPPPPAPTVTLSANPTSVAPQGTSTLTWSSTNATSCTASGGWSGTKATSGSQAVGPLSNTATYTLSCTGTGGTGSDSETVTVTAGGGGGGGTPPEDSGGGGVDLLALLALLAGLMTRGLRLGRTFAFG